MRSFTPRLIVGLVLAYGLALAVCLINGLDLGTAIKNSAGFALFTGLTFALVEIGGAIAERKGYSAWLGFLAILVLSGLGALLLLILPARKPTNKLNP